MVLEMVLLTVDLEMVRDRKLYLFGTRTKSPQYFPFRRILSR